MSGDLGLNHWQENFPMSGELGFNICQENFPMSGDLGVELLTGRSHAWTRHIRM